MGVILQNPDCPGEHTEYVADVALILFGFLSQEQAAAIWTKLFSTMS